MAAIALQIIDREGIEELSMRRLGRELGVTGASLYYHFADKDEILHDVVKLVLSDLVAPRLEESTWQDLVRQSSLAYRAALLNHPNAAPLLISRPWRAYAHDVLDSAVQLAERGGVPRNMSLLIFRATEMICFSSALFSNFSDNDGFGDVDERYPALKWAIENDVWSPDESFELIIEALVQGFSASVVSDD